MIKAEVTCRDIPGIFVIASHTTQTTWSEVEDRRSEEEAGMKGSSTPAPPRPPWLQADIAAKANGTAEEV